MRFRLSCGCARIGVLASQQSNESLCGDVAAKAAVVHSNSQHVLGAAGDDALFSETFDYGESLWLCHDHSPRTSLESVLSALAL